MKKSNDQQYAKARKDYGKDFFAKSGSSSDSGLKKGATTMEKDAVKVGRFATGGAMRQPRDGNMKFASGGKLGERKDRFRDDPEAIEFGGDELDRLLDRKSHPAKLSPMGRGAAGAGAYINQKFKGKTHDVAKDAAEGIASADREKDYRRSGAIARHSMKEDALDKKADAISAKKRGMKPSAFEGTPADERMDKMGTKFPRNKAAKFATGGAAKPVKRNMGGMMGDPAGAMGRLQPPGIGGAMPPVGAAAGALGRLRPPAGQMAPPSPMVAPPMEQQGGEGGQFRRGGKVVKLAMGGVGKQKRGVADKSGNPMKASGSAKPKMSNVI